MKVKNFPQSQRQCVICQNAYTPKRRDSSTCGSQSCTNKLTRLRKFAIEEMNANILSPDDEQLLMWLNKNALSPAESELRTLRAIYGKTAFRHATNAIREIASYYQQTKDITNE